MSPRYLTTSAVNAVRSLGQGWKSEQRGVTVTSTDDDSREEAEDPEATRQLDQVEDDISDELFHHQALQHLDCLTGRARRVYLAILDPAVLGNEQNDLARQLNRSKSWVSQAMKEATDQLYSCIVMNQCPRKKE
jgi:DNA-directed RNA polymerase specialized sigma subunit